MRNAATGADRALRARDDARVAVRTPVRRPRIMVSTTSELIDAIEVCDRRQVTIELTQGVGFSMDKVEHERLWRSADRDASEVVHKERNKHPNKNDEREGRSPLMRQCGMSSSGLFFP